MSFRFVLHIFSSISCLSVLIYPESIYAICLLFARNFHLQTVDTELTRHCAFSLPAVALTLGRKNWGCIRDIYETLASDMQWKVWIMEHAQVAHTSCDIALSLCVCQAVGLFLYLSLSLAQSPECLPDENEIISPLSRPARKPSPECPPNKKKSPITPSSHLTSKQSPKCSPDENESNFGFSNSFFLFLTKNHNFSDLFSLANFDKLCLFLHNF